MKNLEKYFMIVWIVFFWLLWISKADVIPENSHRFDNCVKIENPDEIQGYKLIILINTVTAWNVAVYQVEKDTCLEHHYQFWTSTPYLVKQDLNIQEINDGFKWYHEDSILFEKYLWDDFVKFEPINPNWWYVSNLSNKTYEINIYRLEYQNNGYNLVKFKTESDDDLLNAFYTFGLNWVDVSSVYYKIVKFIISLLLTVIMETIILFFLCKLLFKKDNIKTKKIILTWILASSITLPILRFVLPYVFHNYTVYAITGEVFVTFVEIFIIKYLLDINRQKSTIASIACNLFSVIIGLLL